MGCFYHYYQYYILLHSLATTYFKKDLRIAPHHADSWAALALIYSSHLEQILNVVRNSVSILFFVFFGSFMWLSSSSNANETQVCS